MHGRNEAIAAAIGFNSRRASKERRGSLEMDGFHPRPGDLPLRSYLATLRWEASADIHVFYIYIYMYAMPYVRHGDYYSLDKLPR